MKMIKIWAVCGLILSTAFAFGQGWVRTYDGGWGDDAALLTSDEHLLFAETTSSDSMYLLKTNLDGETVYEQYYELPSDNINPRYIGEFPSGDFLVYSRVDSSTAMTKQHLLKINADGEEIWSMELEGTFPNSLIIRPNNEIILPGFSSLIFLDSMGNTTSTVDYAKPANVFSQSTMLIKSSSDGNIIIAGNRHYGVPGSLEKKHWVLKVDPAGIVIWENEFGNGPNTYTISDFIESPSGGYIFTTPMFESHSVFKIDTNGNLSWQKVHPIEGYPDIRHIINSQDGGYLLSGTQGYPFNPDAFLIKLNEVGDFTWEKRYFSSYSYEGGNYIAQIADGSIFLSGHYAFTSESNLFVMKADSNGIVFTSAIEGQVHIDPEEDCLPDQSEVSLENWLVQINGSPFSSTLTDADGYFSLPVDTGSYEVTITPPGPYWDICNSPASVEVTEFYDTTLLDFPVSAMEDCPYLEVDISAPFLRRCFESTYAVHYCNYGTVEAEDATVEVMLDPFLTYISSSIPFASQNGNTLSFNLGDVDVNECGDFNIIVDVDCDSTELGQIHCTEAHIFPDSLCGNINPLWDMSSIEVDVECVGDSVFFTLTNTGTGSMSNPLDFIIIEDEIVLLQGDFQLNSLEDTTIIIPANGATFHLEAMQSPNHPSGTFSVGATIEGCGGWMSFGFFLQWANGNPNPFVDIDCQPNIGSYDPNDKLAFPEGFGDEHLIEPGTDLDYLIRFQNTGTDTAFKVVILDKLPSELDLTTLRPGASSHPYEYSISPEGWPVFTFDDIMLPDSNVNEAASHGFVRFNISQREGLGWGDYIENSALIYFDFNAPIHTPAVWHKIGQIYPWSNVSTEDFAERKPRIKIAPNPVGESAFLQIMDIEPGELRLVLTDISGRKIREENTFGTAFEFQRNDLRSGIYFIQIWRNGEAVGSGKLMVQ